jgi:hypothetical protein
MLNWKRLLSEKAPFGRAEYVKNMEGVGFPFTVSMVSAPPVKLNVEAVTPEATVVAEAELPLKVYSAIVAACAAALPHKANAVTNIRCKRNMSRSPFGMSSASSQTVATSAHLPNDVFHPRGHHQVRRQLVVRPGRQIVPQLLNDVAAPSQHDVRQSAPAVSADLRVVIG